MDRGVLHGIMTTSTEKIWDPTDLVRLLRYCLKLSICDGISLRLSTIIIPHVLVLPGY